MNKNQCYWNGKITTVDKIKISPYDIGFLRGYGVFDVMCTQNGQPFLLDAHFQRLQNSAEELGLKFSLPKKEYTAIVAKLLKANGFPKSTIRTVFTGGGSPNGFVYCPGRETLLILIEKFQSLPKEIYTKGAQVITVAHRRHLPRVKMTNYVMAIKKQNKKSQAQALEIIYVDNGQALEASTSNFFIVKKGKLITTKDGVLLGITRNIVIQLAKKNKIKIAERIISEKELYAADEIFLTATNKDVVPVVKIDGKKVGDGKVGKTTKSVMQLFQDFVKKYGCALSRNFTPAPLEA